MRTILIIAGGIILWLMCLGISRLFVKKDNSALNLATYIFIGIWFIVAAVNMWIGVAQAGYSVLEELPIFLIIFLLPSTIAYYVKRKMF